MDRGAWRAALHGVAKSQDMIEAMEQAHTPPPPQTASGSVEQEGGRGRGNPPGEGAPERRAVK